MQPVDAVTVANLAVRVGLLKPNQVDEGFDEVGQRGGEAEPFLAALRRKGHLTPFQVLKLERCEKDGYFLGGYRILYKIASGTFGRVYRADDPHTGRIVAVKVLRKKWSDDKHNIELFEREGQMGMSLKHPNIVEILAVNRDPATKQYFIVMEFVEGGNLRDILSIRKKIDGAEVLRILDEVTNGLHYALSRGLTHRDMKLTNILMSSAGTAKLVDFGLATAHGGRIQTERDDLKVDRTVDYAGLEKTTNVSQGDTRSDIFFLGCVAYELLTGRPPLDISRQAKTRMDRERFTTIASISPGEVNAPPSVIRLIENMMSLNPQERFQTPSQTMDAIREVRKELEGRAKGSQIASTSQRTLFFVEKDERLKDILREKFKEKGYRVLMASDPARALERFRQQPFEVLIVDAGTTGEDGLMVFERIMTDAEKYQFPCAGILMLNADQNNLRSRVKARSGGQHVLVQPITFKRLVQAIDDASDTARSLAASE